MAKQPTKAQLTRKVKELEAQLSASYHFADLQLAAMAKKSYMGSAVVVELFALGGAELVIPMAIRDGLSPETIAALRADVRRSYEQAIAFKPQGV